MTKGASILVADDDRIFAMNPRPALATLGVVIIVVAVGAFLYFVLGIGQTIGVSGLEITNVTVPGVSGNVTEGIVSLALSNHSYMLISSVYVWARQGSYFAYGSAVSGSDPISPGQSRALQFTNYGSETPGQSYYITMRAVFEDGTSGYYSATIISK
ncbi:MAG: hypothetical protein ABSG92_08560 [Conexivisphaerales archaeon]